MTILNYRGLSFTDDDFARRNRLGSLTLHAHHQLERYITPAMKKENPQWFAAVDGKPSSHRLKWSAPGLADAIAEVIIRKFDQQNSDQKTASISPLDGVGFDNSPEDRAHDAGDYDPSSGMISLTDRLLWFCNQIAEKVAKKHPDARLGMLAYIHYVRPPVRDKVHPNIVPQIAPITYARAHPITDDNVPDNIDLRNNIEGWAKIADSISYYFYGFFLAETASPNPMITKWSHDVPFALNHGKTIYWQPESLPNFETTAHAHYMGMRLAWDKNLKPEDIISDFNTRYYGQASSQMTAYWQFIDSVWIDTPEYSGCGWGHLVRWTPQNMKKARQLMNSAKRATATPIEQQRIEMADDSLKLFELFMQMRSHYASGNWKPLPGMADAYLIRSALLAQKYRDQFRLFLRLPSGPARTLRQLLVQLCPPPLRRNRHGRPGRTDRPAAAVDRNR